MCVHTHDCGGARPLVSMVAPALAAASTPPCSRRVLRQLPTVVDPYRPANPVPAQDGRIPARRRGLLPLDAVCEWVVRCTAGGRLAGHPEDVPLHRRWVAARRCLRRAPAGTQAGKCGAEHGLDGRGAGTSWCQPARTCAKPGSLGHLRTCCQDSDCRSGKW